MHTLKRSAIVPYTQKQMFELVNNVKEYPNFLPWCNSSTIISQDTQEVVASLEIAWKGIKKTFSTKNILFPYEKTEISLVNGPLQQMTGVWQFEKLDEHACKVLLDLEFAFTGSFIDRLFQPVFQHIANTLVDAFVKRARELYGRA